MCYTGKTKTKLRARFDNDKKANKSYGKKRKYHSSVFMDIMGNTVTRGFMTVSSHQLNNKRHSSS